MQARHASVGALMRSSKRLDMLRESLKGMLDLERLSTQLKYNRSNARDLLATANAIERYQPFSDCAVKPKTAS